MEDTTSLYEQLKHHLFECSKFTRQGKLTKAWKEYDQAAFIFALIPDSKSGDVEYRFARDQFEKLKDTLNQAAVRNQVPEQPTVHSRFKVASFKRKGEY